MTDEPTAPALAAHYEPLINGEFRSLATESFPAVDAATGPQLATITRGGAPAHWSRTSPPWPAKANHDLIDTTGRTVGGERAGLVRVQAASVTGCSVLACCGICCSAADCSAADCSAALRSVRVSQLRRSSSRSMSAR